MESQDDLSPHDITRLESVKVNATLDPILGEVHTNYCRRKQMRSGSVIKEALREYYAKRGMVTG